MPETNTERYDAVVIPYGWRGIVLPDILVTEARAEFGPAMGIDLENPESYLWVRNQYNGGHMLTPSPHDAPNFDKRHPRFPGRSRYEWRMAPGGVRYGTLTPEARAERDREAARLAAIRESGA